LDFLAAMSTLEKELSGAPGESTVNDISGKRRQAMKAVLITNKRLEEVTSPTRTTQSGTIRQRGADKCLQERLNQPPGGGGRPQAEEQQCLKKPDEGPEEKEEPSHPPREGAVGTEIWSPDQGDPAG
jgi:hypothetical protein